MPGTAAVVVAPGAGQTIEGPAGGPLTFKVRGEQTGGTLTVLENVIAPGDGPPLHVHANEDEAWYVLEGELRFRLDTETASAPAGAFVFVPRGTRHCFQNIGQQPAKILVLFTPPEWSASSIASPHCPRSTRAPFRRSAARWAWTSSALRSATRTRRRRRSAPGRLRRRAKFDDDQTAEIRAKTDAPSAAGAA